MANSGETVAHTAAPEAHGTEHEATVLGIFGPGFFVALAMLVVLAIAVWKKVPAAIGKALDKKIAAIRDQLNEASALRKEAEELKREYEAKAASADAEAAAMVERAKGEAQAIVA